MGLPAEAIRSAVAGLSPALRGHLRTARQLVEERQRTPPDELLVTGTVLDRFLDGGLRRGETVELVGDRSSGRFSLVLASLATVTAGGEPAALVDLGDGLDPRLAAGLGVDLARLLWVRPRHRKEAMQAAEAVLGGGLPLVVVDLGLPPLPGGRGAEASWLRLARRAREQRAALMVASPYRVSGTAAQVVVELHHLEVAWRGGGGAPRLLAGLDGHLTLTKDRQAGVPDRRPQLLPLALAEAPEAAG